MLSHVGRWEARGTGRKERKGSKLTLLLVTSIPVMLALVTHGAELPLPNPLLEASNSPYYGLGIKVLTRGL